jgi:hypothetical protein
MLSSQTQRRIRAFQRVSHTLGGLGALQVALGEERGGGPLPWVAGIAAVLLLGLVGWERLQPGAQPVSAQIVAELLGMGVLVGAGVRLGPGLLSAVQMVLATGLAVALVLHRRAHRTARVVEKGAPG